MNEFENLVTKFTKTAIKELPNTYMSQVFAYDKLEITLEYSEETDKLYFTTKYLPTGEYYTDFWFMEVEGDWGLAEQHSIEQLITNLYSKHNVDYHTGKQSDEVKFASMRRFIDFMDHKTANCGQREFDKLYTKDFYVEYDCYVATIPFSAAAYNAIIRALGEIIDIEE